MHRSGLALAGDLLTRLGIVLNPPSASGCEYEAVPDLHRRILKSRIPAGASGIPDWGWPATGDGNEPSLEVWKPAARALIADGEAEGRPWGWRDPLGTLFLDFWAEAAPSARFVLLYRAPWEVADSLQRIEEHTFRDHFNYGHPLWRHYNRKLLDFYHRHRERCLLISSHALIRDPNGLTGYLQAKFGLEFPAVDLTPAVAPGRFGTHRGTDPLIDLLQVAHPESTALLDALERAADWPSGAAWGPVGRLRFATPNQAGQGQIPACSIVIPCYNQGEYLLEAVASVERHAPENCELIIVDDGSFEPWTQSVLTQLQHMGYGVLRQENRGVAAARNAGIAASRAPCILPLDSDNRLRAGYIRNSLDILKANPEAGVVYGDRVPFGARHKTPPNEDFNLHNLLRYNYIDTCSVFRRQVWSDCEGYDDEFAYNEDWEFWVHACRRGWKFIRWPEPAFDYRVRLGSRARSRHFSYDKFGQNLAYCYRKHEAFFRQNLPEGASLRSYIRERKRDMLKANFMEKIAQHVRSHGWGAWRPLTKILWAKLASRLRRTPMPASAA